MTIQALTNLPGPWVQDAVCAQVDPELWFPEPGGAGKSAQLLCASCPVSRQCLGYAMENNERFGVWGGTSPGDRAALRRARRAA